MFSIQGIERLQNQIITTSTTSTVVENTITVPKCGTEDGQVVPNSVEDRVLGMFYASAVGDALGAPHEFRLQRKDNFNGELIHVPYCQTQWQGRFVGSIGQATDDTEMTLTLAHLLVDCKGNYNDEEAVKQYIIWGNSGSRMMGKF